MKRRQFIKRSAIFSAPSILPSSVLGQGGATAPSERIGIGLIGCGGQGNGVFNGILNNKQVIGLAVCDPDAERMNKSRDNVNKRNGSKDCATYGDFRELCANKDIDAVVVGTPDHWHAVAAMEALRNGKDV